MSEKIKQGKKEYWVDIRGDRVPIQYISERDQRREKLVDSVMSSVRQHRHALEEFKLKVFTAVYDYLNEIAGEYDVAWKGNAEIVSFDGRERIQVKVSTRFEFDETLQIAKSLVDKCVRKWSRGAHQHLIQLVNRAFRVDQGRVDVRAILGLKRLEIDDPDWAEAMEIITRATRGAGSKTYMLFQAQDDQGQWQNISLDFAAIPIDGNFEAKGLKIKEKQ